MKFTQMDLEVFKIVFLIICEIVYAFRNILKASTNSLIILAHIK